MDAEIRVLFIAAVAALAVVPQVSGTRNTYVGAVAEYHPVTTGKNPAEITAKNVVEYEKMIKEAKSKNADIIVFPEGGLRIKTASTRIPDPTEKIAPWRHEPADISQAVKDLSMAACEYKIYVVVNLLEKRKCEEDDEDCPSKGFYVFNTNVVFDRTGTVVARYAKYNIFDEFLTEKPPTVEMSFFDTDFGVRFGTFSGFDILFGTPAQLLVKQYKITDFVYTTQWFSELPFLTALQAQRGWAEANDVNLLASGVSNPVMSSAGSGIYNGKYGALVEIMPEKNTRKVLVATISKKNFNSDGSHEEEPLSTVDKVIESNGRNSEDEPVEDMNFRSDQITLFKSEVIPTGTVFEKSVCDHGKFCCDFKVNAHELKPEAKNYTYRAVVFNGVRTYGITYLGGAQVCGVILCKGAELVDCTSRVKEIPGLFLFKEIEIRGRDFKLKNSFQMPSTLSDGKKLRPLPANQYAFVIKGKEKTANVSIELLRPVSDLHTFAIYGRDFSRDNEVEVPVASASVSSSVFSLIASSTAFFIFFRL